MGHPLPKSQRKCAINWNEEERPTCANLGLSYLGLLDRRTELSLFSGCRFCRRKTVCSKSKCLRLNLCTDQPGSASAVSLTVLRSKILCWRQIFTQISVNSSFQNAFHWLAYNVYIFRPVCMGLQEFLAQDYPCEPLASLRLSIILSVDQMVILCTAETWFVQRWGLVSESTWA